VNHAVVKGRQSTWRKVQDLVLVQSYKSCENICQFINMVDTLVYLPESDVPARLHHLHQNVPVCARHRSTSWPADYFDTTVLMVTKNSYYQ